MNTQLVRIVVAIALGVSALAGCRSLTGQSAGRVVDDSAITAQIKTRLAADEAKTLTRIDVDTENGVVYLSGIVEAPATRARAEQIAQSQEGVKRVVNNLQVSRTR